MKYILTFALLLNISCAINQFANNYRSNVDISQVPKLELLRGDPEIVNVDDFEKAYNQALTQGYILLGISTFQGEIEQDYNILQLARDKGATLVIRTSKFSHTEYKNFYIPLTSTSTSNTLAYGVGHSNVYNSRNQYVGSISNSAAATATTTSENTNWVPMQTSENIYLQAGAFFIKSNVQYTLGAYTRDLTTEESSKYKTNKGVVVTHVIRNSPAYDLDLVPGDVITSINKVSIRNTDDLKINLSQFEKVHSIEALRGEAKVALGSDQTSRSVSSIKTSKMQPRNQLRKK